MQRAYDVEFLGFGGWTTSLGLKANRPSPWTLSNQKRARRMNSIGLIPPHFFIRSTDLYETLPDDC